MTDIQVAHRSRSSIRRRCATFLVAVGLLAGAPHGLDAEDDPRAVNVAGKAAQLLEPLEVDAEKGATWMHARDLRALLGITWIEIPELPPKVRGRVRKPKAQRVVLSDPYLAVEMKRGVDIERRRVRIDVLRSFGWDATQAAGAPLTIRRLRTSAWAATQLRVGHKAPSLRLMPLSGELAPAPWTPAKRHLVYFAGTWDASRQVVERMRAFADGLPEVAFSVVFLDLGPAPRVRDYAPMVSGVWFDPLGHLLGRGMRPGSWAYIDEHGVVLAISERNDPLMQDWLRALAQREAADTPIPAFAPTESSNAARVSKDDALVAKVLAAVAPDGTTSESLEAELVDYLKAKPKALKVATLAAGIALTRGDFSKAAERLRWTVPHNANRGGLLRQYLALEDAGRFYDGRIDEKWIRERRRELRKR